MENGMNKSKNIIIIVLLMVAVALTTFVVTKKMLVTDNSSNEQKSTTNAQTNEGKDNATTDSNTTTDNTTTNVATKVSYKLDKKQLYVNDKATGIYAVSKISEIDDIIVFLGTKENINKDGSFDYPMSVVAINSEGRIIYTFKDESESSSSKNNIVADNTVKLKASLIRKEDYFKVSNKSIYITTDNFAQDGEYVACHSNGKDVLTYTEEFSYLGNGKFSNSKILQSLTASEYIAQNGVSCS